MGQLRHDRIGRGVRPLSALVLVLAYSRAIHAVFTLDQTLESFLRGHVEACAALGGCARILMYDYVPRHIVRGSVPAFDMWRRRLG